MTTKNVYTIGFIVSLGFVTNFCTPALDHLAQGLELVVAAYEETTGPKALENFLNSSDAHGLFEGDVSTYNKFKSLLPKDVAGDHKLKTLKYKKNDHEISVTTTPLFMAIKFGDIDLINDLLKTVKNFKAQQIVSETTGPKHNTTMITDIFLSALASQNLDVIKALVKNKNVIVNGKMQITSFKIDVINNEQLTAFEYIDQELDKDPTNKKLQEIEEFLENTFTTVPYPHIVKFLKKYIKRRKDRETLINRTIYKSDLINFEKTLSQQNNADNLDDLLSKTMSNHKFDNLKQQLYKDVSLLNLFAVSCLTECTKQISSLSVNQLHNLVKNFNNLNADIINAPGPINDNDLQALILKNAS